MPVISTMYGVRNQVLFSGSVVTASTTGDGTNTAVVIPGIDRITSALLYLSTGTGTGTSPTLNVYVQTLLPDGLTWTDLVSFTQATTSATTQVASIITQVAAPYTKTDASLAAASLKATHMGSTWRVKIVIGGSSPSYATISLTGNFYE